MKKVFTAKDIDEIIQNGGNFASLPPKAVLTPSAKDRMNDHLRGKQSGTNGSFPKHRPTNARASHRNEIPIHEPEVPDYEYTWSAGKDPQTPEQIAAFFYSTEIETLKSRICDIGQRMWQKGYVDGNGGNITIRVGDNLALCTPTLISKGFMKPEEVCLVDLDANQLAGKRKRTSEAKTHFAIMKATPKAKACVHAHPVHATAFAVGGMDLPTCLIPEAEVFLGKVGLARYETPGTDKNAKAVGEIAPNHQAILMQNHGVICWGNDVEDAYWKMENTEAYCQTITIAQQIGADLSQGYGPDKLRELIDIRKQLGMDDYRDELSNQQICGNSSFVEQTTQRPGQAQNCGCSSTKGHPQSTQNQPEIEALVQQITDEITAQVRENDGLPD